MKEKIKRILIWIIILAIASIFVFMVLGRSYTYTVGTWDGWCSQLLGVNLFEKYNARSIRFDDEAIRTDFVQKYNDFIVEKIAEQYLDGVRPTDKVVQELVQLKMIGAWNEKNDLYLVNSLLLVDEKMGIDEFSEWENNFRKYLNLEEGRQKMDDFQYCIYGTINTHFQNFILIGPNDRSVIIPLEFTRKEAFK